MLSLLDCQVVFIQDLEKDVKSESAKVQAKRKALKRGVIRASVGWLIEVDRLTELSKWLMINEAHPTVLFSRQLHYRY
jgi:hypothetical protein